MRKVGAAMVTSLFSQFVRGIRLAWVVVVILAVLALVAIGVATGFALGRAPSGGASSSSTSILALGTPAQIGSTQATAASVRIVPIDHSHMPSANAEFIAVSMRLANMGNGAAAYSMNDFVVRDQAGNVFEPDPAASSLGGVNAMPTQMMMQPGGRMSGEIVFEMPMSDHAATLIWQPSVSSTGDAASWAITM